jgi:hypothetical protein
MDLPTLIALVMDSPENGYRRLLEARRVLNAALEAMDRAFRSGDAPRDKARRIRGHSLALAWHLQSIFPEVTGNGQRPAAGRHAGRPPSSFPPACSTP